RRRRSHLPAAPSKGRHMTVTASTAERGAARQARPHPVPARVRAQRALLNVIIAVIVIVQVYPMLWLLLTSFRTAADFAGGNPFALPTDFTLENYGRAFGTGNLWLNIVNSL